MMYHPNETARRARIASLGLVGLFLFLGASFFRVQVIENDRYALQSEQNRLRTIPLPAPRGIIYDRNNEVIAENVPGFTVSLHARSADSLFALLQRFSELLPLDPNHIARLTNKRTFTSARPTVILSDATFEQVSLLMEHQVDFPGLTVQSAPKRHYPDGSRVATFVGYTGEISEADLEQDRYKEYKQGQQIGELGLEDQYEELLRGREGTRFLEVDSRERVVRDDARPQIPAQPGEPLYTNIDLRLQKFIADSVLADTLKGAILVMETVSGAVLALHSAPSYDPNDFIGGISHAKWDALRTDPRKPLVNRATSGTYPPASTFKLVTAVLGLQEGLVTMDSRMADPCKGGYQLGNRFFACWKREGHGSLTLSEAIAQSCNVYFFQLGRRLGLSRLLGGGVNLGLAARSGIDLPGEVVPNMPADETYFNSLHGRNWSAPATELNISIGQGEVTQTILSIARFYSALATDGHAARPQVIKGVAPERELLLDLRPEQLQRIRDALSQVVEAGTAAGARQAGLKLAGKTGTAQNSGGKDHGWFVGFAPADKPTPGSRPQILVAIIIEHGEHGSTVARAASRVLSFHFNREIQVQDTGG